MSGQPTRQFPEPGSLRCPRCSANLGPEQDWCLECGAPARTRLAPTPNWQLPTVAIGAVIALAGALLAFAFVTLTNDDDTAPAGTTPTAVAETVPPAVVPPLTATSTLPTATTTAPVGPAEPGTVVPGQTTPTATVPTTAAPPASTTTTSTTTTTAPTTTPRIETQPGKTPQKP